MQETPAVISESSNHGTVSKDHSNTPGTIKLTEKNGINIRTKLLFLILQYIYTPCTTFFTNPAKRSPEQKHDVEVPRRVRKHYDVTPVEFREWVIYDIKPKGSKPTRRILYFPGGSFALAAQPQHFAMCADVFSRYLDAVVTIILYPLAPHNKAHDIVPLVFELYQTLLDDAQYTTVDVAGDSSGGNLALVTAQHAVLNGLRPPSNVMLIAPSLDMSMSNPLMKEVQKVDIFQKITVDDRYHELWIGDFEKTNPLCSPLFNDPSWKALKEMGVKVHLVIGTADILEPDTRILREKLNHAGVEGEWLRWKGMVHCFPLIFRYHVKEAEVATRWITDVMKRNV